VSVTGFPSERDLAFLLGQTLVELELRCQFRFQRAGGAADSWGTISCECEWSIRNPRGEVIDHRPTPAWSSVPTLSDSERKQRMTELIGRTVTGVRVEDPDDRELDQAIELHFEGGYVLRFVANRGPCESLGVQPGDLFF